MSRRPIIGDRAPPVDLTPPDARVWVEGEAFVNGFDEKARLCVDRARSDLGMIGLTLMEYPTAPEDTSSARRRRWTMRRMSIDEADAILRDQSRDGITYDQFAEILFREDPWTALKQYSALQKTNVLVHKMKKLGLISKDRNAQGRVLLFSTRASTRTKIPPILSAAIRRLEPHLEDVVIAEIVGLVRQHMS